MSASAREEYIILKSYFAKIAHYQDGAGLSRLELLDLYMAVATPILEKLLSTDSTGVIRGGASAISERKFRF